MNRVNALIGGIMGLAVGGVAFREDLHKKDEERRFGNVESVVAETYSKEIEIRRYEEGFEKMQRGRLVSECREKLNYCLNNIESPEVCGMLLTVLGKKPVEFYKDGLVNGLDGLKEKKVHGFEEVYQPVADSCFVGVGREVNKCEKVELECLKGGG